LDINFDSRRLKNNEYLFFTIIILISLIFILFWYKFLPFSLIIILFLISFFGFILISLLSIRIGLLTFIIVSLFSNFFTQIFAFNLYDLKLIGIGPVIRDIFLLSLLTSWFFILSLKKDKSIYIPIRYPLVYMVIIAMYILFSPDEKTAILGFRNVAFYIIIAYLSCNIFLYKIQIKKIVTVLVFMGIFLSIFSLDQPLTGGKLLKEIGFNYGTGGALVSYSGIIRSSAGIDNPLVFGIFLVTLILISLYLDKSTKKSKIFITISIIIMFIALVYTFSRGAMLALFGGIFLISFFIKRYKIIIALTLLLAFILVLLTFSDSYNFYNDNIYFMRFLSQDKSSKLSLSIRLNQISESLNYLKKNPLFGIGLGTQGAAKERFKDNIAPGIVTDNYYMQILLEMGLIGLFSFILLFFVLFKKAIRIYNNLGDIYLKRLALGITSCITAVSIMNLFSSTFDSRIFNIFFWFLIGLLFSLENVENNNKSEKL